RIDFRDGVTANVLNPPAGESPPGSDHPDNNGSLVIRVQDGDTAILLTGDAEAPAEEDMLESGLELHADVLKLGHHGSHTSSTEPFLDAVRPQVGIVSAGVRNSFGHP